MLAALRYITEEDYLALERQGSTKHELHRGHVFAMAGASARHNLIAGNVAAALRAALRPKRCLVFQSDQRVHNPATGSYAYPDVVVTCDRPLFHDGDPDSLVNPRLVVEVLSASTEARDRGRKFVDCRRLPSLQDYLLVSQAERRLEHYHRLSSGQWVLTTVEGEGALALPGLDAEIQLADVYADLDLLEDLDESPAPPSAIQPS